MSAIDEIERRRAVGEKPTLVSAEEREIGKPVIPKYCRTCGRELVRTNLRHAGFNERTGAKVLVYDYQCPKYGFFGMFHAGPSAEFE